MTGVRPRYLLLLGVVALSSFPVYWTFTIASQTNEAVGQTPPPFIPGGPGLFDVGGLGRDLTEGQLISLAHRNGAWRPAFERYHRAGPKP